MLIIMWIMKKSTCIQYEMMITKIKESIEYRYIYKGGYIK